MARTKADEEAGEVDTRVDGVEVDHPENRIALSPSVHTNGIGVEAFLLLHFGEKQAGPSGTAFKRFIERSAVSQSRTRREWEEALVHFNNTPVI